MAHDETELSGPTPFVERIGERLPTRQESLDEKDPARFEPAIDVSRFAELELSFPIYWMGRQWAVTKLGIECLVPRRSPYYYATWDVIPSVSEQDRMWWIAQDFVFQPWVDHEDFWAALAKAVELKPRVKPG